MIKKNLVVFLLFIVQVIYCQEIQVTVKEITGKTIDNINVQLLKNNKTIYFQTTNEIGVCSFVVTEKGNYSLKFTSMLYKTKFVEINTNEKTIFEVILDPQLTEIKEVTIKARPKIATYKQDTISYNIKAIKDGTERTVEDIVKKLPGLDVNENGKITNNGKIIGQVLVEGNEFFGKNHKMATQNISAEMIDGIDFWENYTTVSGNKSTAINLKLKSEYKNKITGNTDVYYGNRNSYLLHTNLFKFSKKGNLAFIGDANSIAKDPIGVWDYNDMVTMDEIENAASNKISLITPSFLNNDGKVQSKNNGFGALQYSKTNKNFSVTAFSIFNTAQLEKLMTTSRTAFPGQPNSYNYFETKNENNNGFFGTTQLKLRKNFTPNSYIYYNFGYNPTADSFNQNMDITTSNNIDFIENKNKNNGYGLGNLLSWTKNFDNTQMILVLRQQKNNENSILKINSSQDLFLTPSHSLEQNLHTNSDRYEINLFLKNNFDFARVNFQSGYSVQNQEALLSELYSNNSEKLKLQTQKYINELYVSKYIWHFDVSAKLRSNFVNYNSIDKHFFEKSLSIKYQPKNGVTRTYSFDYTNKYSSPDFIQLLYNKLYDKNLQYTQNYNLTPDLLVNSDSFSFTFYRFNMTKGNHFMFLLNYEKSKENFNKDITNFGKFSQAINILGSWRDYFLFLFSDDRRLNENLILKSKFTGFQTRTNNLVQNQPNQTDFKNIQLEQKLRSNFKKIPFQFELGYTYNQSFSEQSFYQTKTTQKNIRLNLAIKTSFRKEWIGNILGEYLLQKSPQISLQNFLLGGQISYKKTNTNLEYNLLFNNILNFNYFKYINSNVSMLGIDQTTVYALPGYITGGIRYNF